MGKSISLRGHTAVVCTDGPGDACREEVTETLAPYLQCVLDDAVDGFTFGDVWRLIEADATFYDLVFRQATGGVPISAFAADARRPAPGADDGDRSRLTAVRFAHTATVNESADEPGPTGSARTLDLFVDMFGVGTAGASDGPAAADNYALECMSVGTLMALPLQLDEAFRVDLPVSDAGGLADGATVDCGCWPFTVYELLEAILNEVTYYGPPAAREAFNAELEEGARQARLSFAQMRAADAARRPAGS